MEDFEHYLNKRNSIELLELIAFVQLYPENHGKNLRLEIIQSHIVNNLSRLTSDFNYDGTINAIRDFFPSDYREDPPETSFTENFLYMNGNNIVFPGIVIDSTVIVQKMSSIALFEESKLPNSIKKRIGNVLFFMLDLYNQIAEQNGFERYMKPICEETEIFFPEETVFKNRKDTISFSSEEIESIYQKFKIEDDLIKEFLFDWENSTIDIDEYDKNPLLFKPFIKYGERYYLAMPTSQMYALDNFIINTLNEVDCLNEIVDLFDSDIISDTKIELSKMGWSRTDLDKKIESKIEVFKGESFWRFDENKIAYVHVLPNVDFEFDIENRANEILSIVKDEVSNDSYQFFVLFIMSTYSSLEPQFLGLSEIAEANHMLLTGIFDLKRIVSNWDLDKLSLWKYAKAFKIAIEKGMQIGPGYSILTYYSYYENNHESFFNSDKAYGGIFFDFSIQGDIIIEDNLKLDKHGVVRYIEDKGFGYTPVFKTDAYAPIYLSEELFLGEYRKVFTGFGFPIWVIRNEEDNAFSKYFIDAVVFWFHELSQTKNIYFEFNGPIEIAISLSEDFFNLDKQNENKVNEVKDITYELNPESGKIIVYIPDTYHGLLHREDNIGERLLMEEILISLSNIMNIYGKPSLEKKQIVLGIQEAIPLGPAKMILTAVSADNLVIDNSNIPNLRYIPKSDESYVLENVIKWLDYEKEIPENIEPKEDKIKILVDCVNAIIKEIRRELKKYDTLELIKFLMLKNESTVQHQEYRKLYIPARLACFSKYKDIVEEYQHSEDNIVNVSLALRCLIEFVHAEPYHGAKLPNDDDVDYLLALIHEMIYFGTVQDSIRFDIDNPKIGLLETGRLGISKDFYIDILTGYNSSFRQDELLDYADNFYHNFPENGKDEAESQSSIYYEKVDKVFAKEWGITLPEIYSISHFLAEYCLFKQKSLYYLNEKELVDLIIKETSFKKSKIDSYLKTVVLNSRGKIDKAPIEYDMPEIFPWRYNRKLSYLRKPLIKIEVPNKETIYLWSARFMVKSAGNLFYQFSNASLRVEEDQNGLKNLIAKRNNLKGRSFRNSVFEWMRENTGLTIVPYEVKIDVNGTLKANKNYGDIDILAFDEIRKIIYSIECKNTRQVKIMYDFQRDLKNYINVQLPKHERRHKWLNGNKDSIILNFNLKKGDYKVNSMVISSFQLPVKFLNATELPIFSFNEVKRTRFFDR